MTLSQKSKNRIGELKKEFYSLRRQTKKNAILKEEIVNELKQLGYNGKIVKDYKGIISLNIRYLRPSTREMFLRIQKEMKITQADLLHKLLDDAIRGKKAKC